MKRVLLTLALVTTAVFSAQAEVLLDASFNDKPIDVPIGTGGAEVGEPTAIGSGLSAIVRSSPMSSSSLEIKDIVDFGAHTARFDFVGLSEVNAGKVAISLELWFAEFDDYVFYVRESQFAGSAFLTLAFRNSGNLMYSDADNGGNTEIGSYELGRPLHLFIEFDMDAGTYNVTFDGSRLLEGETHGITDDGIGSVSIGIDHDADLLGTVYVDNLFVSTGEVFADGFENGDSDRWSSVMN